MFKPKTALPIAVLICVIAAITISRTGPPAIEWRPYSLEVIEQAKRNGEPVILDFYADWCLPCHEMDLLTYRNADVVTALEKYAKVKVDLTSPDNAVSQEAAKRYGVQGLPSIHFIHADGREIVSARLAGFIDSPTLLNTLRAIDEGGET